MKTSLTTGFFTCLICRMAVTKAASIKSAFLRVDLKAPFVNSRPALCADDPFDTVKDRATAVQTLWVLPRRSPRATIEICCSTK